MILGLAKIIYKKYTFLCTESGAALDVLNDPFSSHEVHGHRGGGGGGAPSNASKKRNNFITAAKAMDISKLTMPGFSVDLIKDSDLGSLHEKAMLDQNMKAEDGNFADDFD